MPNTLDPNSSTASSPDSSADTSGASSPAPVSAAPPASIAPSSAAPPETTAITTDATIPSEPLKGPKPWYTNVYTGILDALGGRNDVTYSRDPNTGKMVQTSVPSTPGSQWKRIIAGGIAGAGAAMREAGTGPGQLTRAAGAGIAGGAEQATQRTARARQQANEDFEGQRTVALDKARTAMLNQQLTTSAFELARMKVNARFEDATRENQLVQAIQAGGQGSVDLGTASNMADVIALHKNMPNLVHEQAAGNIIGVPHVNGAGQVDGMHYALVTPEWKAQKLDSDQTFYKMQPPTKPGDKPTVGQFTVKAGTMSNGDFWNARMSAEKEVTDFYLADEKARIEAQEATAKETQEYASANLDRARVAALNNATSAESLRNNSRMLVEGDMDPSQLSKRSKTYDQQITDANTYSMETYGVPFNMAKAQADYKFATQTSTFNTLNYLDSLVGRDNQSGNLAEVVNLSNKLRRTDFPALNNIEAWTKLQAGDPQVAAYYTALTESADQMAKIMQGGGTGSGTSDAKMRQALELFDKGFNKKQMAAVAGESRQLLANRKTGIIGDNRYLLQWRGLAKPRGGGPQLPGQGKTISLAAAKQLDQFKGQTDQQIQDAATQLGYTVTQ